ncbi:hypothetical protein [Sulfurimonas indica]|uniref:hypothetical protein n=1 Tax=Sulfurimonas indica TaxID=2508707 RepID=UPI00126541C9|nr:hypothetical protein [Sulfurimonas indica]
MATENTNNKEIIEIRYILPGLITAQKPEDFEAMSKKQREGWAFDILSDKTDFELVKGTYTLENNNGSDSCLQDAHKVYDETPYVEAIASGCGEKLHYTTSLWNTYSEQLGKQKNAISVEMFKVLLEKADVITIDGSPYCFMWDFEDDYLLSTKYEEDGFLYKINIDEDNILGIFKENEEYRLVCENTDYKVSLHTLGAL